MRSLTVVSLQRRITAVALSAALTVGAVFPPAGLALVAEGDQEQEGTADPGAPAPPDSTADPDFDPGGEDVLPFDVGAPTDDGDESAPVESEPVQDPDALAVPDDQPEDGGTDLAAPPLADAPPVQAPTPPAPALPAAEATPQQLAEALQVASAEPSKGRDRAATRQRQRAKHLTPRPVVTIPAPAPPTETVPVAAPSGSAPTRMPHIDGGSRTYIVQQGDCLWTIATALRVRSLA